LPRCGAASHDSLSRPTGYAARTGHCRAPSPSQEGRQGQADEQDWADRKAFKAALKADEDRIGRLAAGVVARAITETSQAPTWAELGHAMGWPPWWQRNWAIPYLAKRGWLVTGTEPRSLHPGPKAAQP